ncbi:MAG: hypothetical protein R3B84_05870 [Zavarzinella sp.]
MVEPQPPFPWKQLTGVCFGMLLPVLGLATWDLLQPKLHARIVHANRYSVPLHDRLLMPIPDGSTREDFLQEILYIGAIADRQQLLDPQLTITLHQSFARHPKVKQVQSVSVNPEGMIEVKLIFRNRPESLENPVQPKSTNR